MQHLVMPGKNHSLTVYAHWSWPAHVWSTCRSQCEHLESNLAAKSGQCDGLSAELVAQSTNLNSAEAELALKANHCEDLNQQLTQMQVHQRDMADQQDNLQQQVGHSSLLSWDQYSQAIVPLQEGSDQ